MTTNDSDELRDELRQGSEARHYGNRVTPDGKEYVEMVPLDWAVETCEQRVREAEVLGAVKARQVINNECNIDTQATGEYLIKRYEELFMNSKKGDRR